MPGKMIKNGDGSYRVVWGGHVRAKSTTKEKAQHQLNLLRAEEHGWKPTRRRKNKSE